MRIDFNWEDKKFLIFYAGSVAASFYAGMWFSNKQKEVREKELEEIRKEMFYNAQNGNFPNTNVTNGFNNTNPFGNKINTLPTVEDQYRMHQASVKAAKGFGFNPYLNNFNNYYTNTGYNINSPFSNPFFK